MRAPPVGKTIQMGTLCGKMRDAAMREVAEFDGVFAPEDIAILITAHAEVCNQLKVAPGDRPGREAVAIRIIDLAKAGMRDAHALRDRVVVEALMMA